MQTEIYQFLQEVFYTPTEIWGWFGPVGLVIFGIFLAKKERFLGLIWIILLSLVTYSYYELATVTAGYNWHALICLLGVIVLAFRVMLR